MSLRGSLRTMPIADLLDWIDRRFVCGTLTIECASTVRTFHFDSGYVTGASSNVPSEHLGQLLMERGLVDEQTLNDAFQVQADTGVLLGKILIMVGAMDNDGLKRVLEDKIREAIFEAMAWKEGTFQFELMGDDEAAAVSEFEVSLNLNSTLEAGEVRAQEWGEIRELIPVEHAVLELVDESRLRHPADPPELTRAIDNLVPSLRKQLTLSQIVLDQNGQNFRVSSLLAKLVDRKAIRVQEAAVVEAVPAADSAVELARAAQKRAAGGDRSGALELAAAALALEPENETLKKLHRELERSVFAELSRVLLSEFRVPKLLKQPAELEAIEMSDTERYLAGRIDGRWDLLSLMRISPVREVEALIIFKRLADRGIISL